MKSKHSLVKLFLLFIIGISSDIYAQTDYISISVPHIDSPYNTSDAVNSLTEHFSIGTTYTNNFFLPQVGLADLKIVYHTKPLNISAGASFYGYSEFYGINASLGFSHYFKPYIAIGLEAFFRGYRFSGDTGFKATGGLNISLLAFPTKKIAIGLYAENVSFSPIRANGITYRVPTSFYVAFSYSFTQDIMLAIEGVKELKSPFLIRLDFEYRPVRQFILRCGTSYQTSASANIGFGLRFGKFILDANVKYNVRVSWGCQVGIGIQMCNVKLKNEKRNH